MNTVLDHSISQVKSTFRSSIKIIMAVYFSLFFMFSASAEEQWYKVELLIFSAKESSSRFAGGEIWDKELQLDEFQRYIVIDTPDQLDTTDTGGTSIHYNPLSSNRHTLTGIKNKLRLNGGYNILYHKAWNQPIEAKAKALPIKITSGAQFGDYSELSGSIVLSRSRYFHVETQLNLASFEQIDPLTSNLDGEENEESKEGFNPVNWLSEQLGGNEENGNDLSTLERSLPIEKIWVPKEVVTLNQSRRMRSKELHYLDNPRLSLFITVTPFKSAKKTSSQAVSG